MKRFIQGVDRGQTTLTMMKFRGVHLIIVAALFLAGCATDVQFLSRAEDPNAKSDRVTGLLFKPNGKGIHPAVVLLHTCGGFRPHVTEDWPVFLTGLGYVVLSVDTLGSRGYSLCTEVGSPSWYEQAKDAYGALDYLAGLPFVDGSSVAVMGFSMGALAINGTIANRDLQLANREYWVVTDAINAHRTQVGGGGAGGKIDPKPRRSDRDFKAAIALYGHCYEIDAYTHKNVPLMEIVAENDKKHAPSCIYAGQQFPIQVHVLKGAYHAFDKMESRGQLDPGGSIMIYSAAAHTEAERHVKSFLAEHLGK